MRSTNAAKSFQARQDIPRRSQRAEARDSLTTAGESGATTELVSADNALASKYSQQNVSPCRTRTACFCVGTGSHARRPRTRIQDEASA